MMFHYSNRTVTKVLSVYNEMSHESRQQVQKKKEEGCLNPYVKNLD